MMILSKITAAIGVFYCILIYFFSVLCNLKVICNVKLLNVWIITYPVEHLVLKLKDNVW